MKFLLNLKFTALLITAVLAANIQEEMQAMVNILDASKAKNHTAVLEQIQLRKNTLKSEEPKDLYDIVG